VGPKRIGKTSLIRLLLATADLSPALPMEARSNLEAFLTKPHGATGEITEISAELLDGLSLTVVDTPGLDYRDGRELVLETQINSIVREIERRYGDSVVEESRVVRGRASGKHIHL
jgi:septin family protein